MEMVQAAPVGRSILQVHSDCPEIPGELPGADAADFL